MRSWIWAKQVLDYLGGAADNPPADAPRFLTHPIFLGIWWGVLIIILVVVFWGQI